MLDRDCAFAIDFCRVLKQHEVVKVVIVVVVEIHDASHEGVVLVRDLFLSLGLIHDGHHDRTFQKVGRRHQRVSVKLFEVRNFLDSLCVDVHLLVGLKIGITSTIFDPVADFFAAGAASVLDGQGRLLFVVRLVVFTAAQMFAELAPRLVFSPLSAAPPHLTPKLRQMNSAGPVEVFRLREVFIAVFASFRVNGPISLREFRDFFLHFFLFILHLLDLLFQFKNLLLVHRLALSEQTLLLHQKRYFPLRSESQRRFFQR